MIVETNNAKETFELGVQIGKEAKAGDVYTLIGDLGVGKTVFTQGLAKGLEIDEPISSPTFTIVQVYEEGRLPFYHFDVYRIGKSDIQDRKGRKMIVETNNAKETFELGVQIGKEAKAGDVYTLIGDLGVGKTVFTQGLAKGLEIDEPISSPTFTIVQVYEEGRLPFYHFDVYRIGDVEEMEEIGYEDYIYGQGVSLIEWSNLIEEILPEQRREIIIEKDLEKGFDYRRITITERE